jgi:hypothetical protein
MAFEQLLDVGSGDLTLHRGVGRQDYFLHLATRHAPNQEIKPQRLRTNPGQGIEMTAQDMVATPKLAGPLDHGDCRWLFYHTERPAIPARIAADLAKLSLREIAALGTGTHSFGDPHQGGRQAGQALRRLLQ